MPFNRPCHFHSQCPSNQPQHPTIYRSAERFTNDQQELKPEPSLESFGIKLPKEEGGEAGTSGSGKRGGAKGPESKGEDEPMEGGKEDEGEEGGIWVPEGIESSEEEEEEGDGEEEEEEDEGSSGGEAEEGAHDAMEDGEDEDAAAGGWCLCRFRGTLLARGDVASRHCCL